MNDEAMATAIGANLNRAHARRGRLIAVLLPAFGWRVFLIVGLVFAADSWRAVSGAADRGRSHWE